MLSTIEQWMLQVERSMLTFMATMARRKHFSEKHLRWNKKQHFILWMT